jgi:hypothetical protein
VQSASQDVQKNSFNIYRAFVRVHGAEVRSSILRVRLGLSVPANLGLRVRICVARRLLTRFF